ncbi:MAG: sugar phosphate isomerase/epimerase [Bryobacteraceae bacterium]
MPKSSRRELFGLLATAATAVAAPKTRIPVGGHPWLYAKFRPNYDINGILDQIFADFRYAGMDGIELIYTVIQKPEAVDQVAALSSKNKLPIIGMSYQADMWDRSKHNAIIDEVSVLLPRLQRLGGHTMGTGVGTPNRKKTAAEFDAQADVLRKLIPLCRKHGVVLNLHNHTYEVKDGEYDLNGTLSRIPDAPLGPDLGWLAEAGIDPVDFIRRRGKQIVFAHLRDRKADGKFAEVMGEGVVDYAGVARELRAVHFKGTLVIELTSSTGKLPERPLRECFKLSRDYVRRVMGW